MKKIHQTALCAMAFFVVQAAAQSLPLEAERAQRIDRLKEITAGSPKDVGSWHDLGQLLYEADRFDEAIEAESRAIAIHPKYAVAFYGRGRSRMQKREYALARTDFTAAITLWESRGGLERFLTEEVPKPEHVASYRDRGISFAHEGRFQEGIADLDIAVKLRKDDPVLLFERAHLEEKAGRKSDAIADFHRAGLIRAERGDVKGARDCVSRLTTLGASTQAKEIEKRLEPKPRGDDLPQ